VLLRHYPELRPALRGIDNAFKPWDRPGDGQGLLGGAEEGLTW